MGLLGRLKRTDRAVLPSPPVGGPAAGIMFERYKDIAGRIAVVDTETTGIYPSSRIVEIAVITLNLQGHVIDEWETLVNPGRDVGPTHIHGVTAEMVRHAPTFESIADELATRLHGAILCAHNLAFDVRMVHGEYHGLGAGFDPGVGFDTLAVTGTRLASACAQQGIRLDDAHRAACDARATAQLLTRVLDDMDVPAVPATVAAIGARPAPCLHRTTSGPPAGPPPFLASVIAAMTHQSAPGATAAYLELLDRAMADLHLDTQERQALAGLAADLGLTPIQIDRTNRTWFEDLLGQAVADGRVDDDEYDQLLRAAHVLGLGADTVAERTADYRTITVQVRLTPGLGVTFTGVDIDAEPWVLGHLRGLGLTHEDSVTKSRTGLLIAADPATESGKAKKARGYGIPIADIGFLLAANPGTAITGTVTEPLRRQTVECATCSRPFTRTPTRSRKPVSCESCTR